MNTTIDWRRPVVRDSDIEMAQKLLDLLRDEDPDIRAQGRELLSAARWPTHEAILRLCGWGRAPYTPFDEVTYTRRMSILTPDSPFMGLNGARGIAVTCRFTITQRAMAECRHDPLHILWLARAAEEDAMRSMLQRVGTPCL